MNRWYNETHTSPLIDGCTQWIYERLTNFFQPFYVNFMFYPLTGSRENIVKQMHNAVEKSFYPRFCTRFARHPRRTREQRCLPEFWLLPDLPVKKHERMSIREVTINDGLHFNGFMLIPLVSRFRGNVTDHFRDKQAYYARYPIVRINVQEIYDVPNISNYAHKTVSWGRVSWEDALMLPRPVSELPANRVPEDPSVRQIKDIMAALNVSEQVAAGIAAPTRGGGGQHA